MDKNKLENEIIENVLITYSNGQKELFRSIQLTKEGIITGRFMNNGEFIGGEFIYNSFIIITK